MAADVAGYIVKLVKDQEDERLKKITLALQMTVSDLSNNVFTQTYKIIPHSDNRRFLRFICEGLYEFNIRWNERYFFLRGSHIIFDDAFRRMKEVVPNPTRISFHLFNTFTKYTMYRCISDVRCFHQVENYAKSVLSDVISLLIGAAPVQLFNN